MKWRDATFYYTNGDYHHKIAAVDLDGDLTIKIHEQSGEFRLSPVPNLIEQSRLPTTDIGEAQRMAMRIVIARLERLLADALVAKDEPSIEQEVYDPFEESVLG